MNILDRITQFINNQAIDAAHIEQNLGLGKDFLQDNSTNEGAVSAQTLALICIKYPSINPIWLLTGVGEMLTEDYQQIGKVDIDSSDGIYRVIAGKDMEIELLKEHIIGLNELIQMKNNLIEEFKNR